MANPNKFTAKEVLNKVLLDSSGNAVSANSVTSQEALSMALDATNNRLNVALEGGTISGDVTISGDLTVQGDGSGTYDEIIEGNLQVGNSSTADSNIVIESSSSGDPKLQFTATANRSALIDFVEGSTLQGAIVYKHNGDTLGFSTGSTNRTERFVVNETSSHFTSNLGVGTDSPDQTMHIHKASAGSIASDSNTVLTVENSNHSLISILSPEAKDGAVMFGNPTDGALDGRLVYDNADRALQFWTAGTERVTIKSDGSATFAGDVTISSSTSNKPELTLENSNNDDSPAYITFKKSNSGSAADGDEVGQFQYKSFNDAGTPELTTYADQYVSTEDVSNGSEDGSMTFRTMKAGTLTKTLVLRSGNIGINNDSPDKLLHLKSSGSESPCIRIENNNDDQYPPRIQFVKDAGNDAEADYDQLGSISFRGQDTNNNLGTFAHIVGKSLDVTDSTEDGQLVIDVMKNNDADGVQVFIDPVGFDVYGTPLKVFGANTGHETSALCMGQDTSALSQIRAYGADDSTAGTLEFRMTSSAGAVNQGVMKLDANSRISLSNNDSGGTGGSDSLSANTILGYLAGEDIASGGVDNTYFGHKAGSNNATGDDGVFIGSNAGKGSHGNSNSYNVGIGSDCMLAVTTGQANVAVGFSAMAAETDGGDNVAVGQKALLALTSSTRNTVVGASAMRLMDDTADGLQECTAVGAQAFYGNATNTTTDANYTTAIGAFSCYSLTTGGKTTGLGWKSLYTNTTGNSNTAIGAEALYYTNTTSQNTAVGDRAGAYTAGDNNSYLGFKAGFGASGAENNNVGIGASSLLAVTTGSSNTSIGKDSSKGLTDGHNNVAIGNNALETSTSVGYAVAIGDDAMKSGDATSAADGTIAIGGSALMSLTSGAGNTAVGYQALDAEDAGGNSTAVGYQALSAQNNDTGHNTAVGWTAGDLIVGGYSNTIIGSEAGTTGTNDLVGGYQNVLIGQAVAASSASAINQIVIGRGAVGVADNAVTLGNSSVTRVAIPNGAMIGCQTTVSMADDAVIKVIDSQAGGAMVYVYDSASGGGGAFFCTYMDAAVKVAGSSNTAATDSDGNLCVYKSTSDHDVYVKNRLGGTKSIAITIVSALAS